MIQKGSCRSEAARKDSVLVIFRYDSVHVKMTRIASFWSSSNALRRAWPYPTVSEKIRLGPIICKYD